MRSAIPLFSDLPSRTEPYRTIVADPPWSFRDKGSRIAPDEKGKRAKGRGYSTLTLDEICALGRPLAEIIAPDVLLFLWTTSAHLIDGSASRVALAWGFEPKTTMVWVKVPAAPRLPEPWRRSVREGMKRGVPQPRETARALEEWACREFLPPRLQIGMGHYVRAAHEPVLVCRRGRARVLRRNCPSVLFAPRGEHSAKPARMLEIAQSLHRGPYLELFSRRTSPGWDGWGNEYPADAPAEVGT